MSHQSEIPHGRDDDFGLIETLLYTRGQGFHLVAEHMSRLRASAAALGFSLDEAAVGAALEAALGPEARQRARAVLRRDGTLEASATPIDAVAEGTIWKVAPARVTFRSDDPLLRHKTTRRALYEDELAAAQARGGADEVLFFNERGEACEGARCNVFVASDGVLLTPPLSSGLLPGTLRAHYLTNGKAREAVLRKEDFSNGAVFYMGNSVRGLVAARWAGDDRSSL
jgi:4-amino-4-deoxychorismate lyase